MDFVDNSEIAFEAVEKYENYGTEDPRVAYRASD
jgi:hypothetical protein